MNPIQHINLGGLPFTIDEEAYTILNRYITTLENHFKKSEGGQEIMNDIEARIGDLFNEKLGRREIVTEALVEDMIDTMGSPEDIIYDAEEEYLSSNRPSDKRFGLKTGKRLFRDPEDKIVGGVCSGLAQYFGITDPIWIRGLFAFTFFAGGSSVLAYIILMMIVPVAKTAADRLAMQGEAINVDSIAREVREQFEELENKFHGFKIM